MDYVDALGYVASGLVFASFSVKTMLPLRYIAVASNVFFALYGYFGSLAPVLILHVVLLPMNLYRLFEIRRTVRELIRASHGDLNVEWLLPFMKKHRYQPGTVLFAKGDFADTMYYIGEGTVILDEIGIELGPGTLLGEIGLFSADRERLFGARCKTAATIYSISDRSVHTLSFENREFGVFLTRLICQRLVQNINELRSTTRAPG